MVTEPQKLIQWEKCTEHCKVSNIQSLKHFMTLPKPWKNQGLKTICEKSSLISHCNTSSRRKLCHVLHFFFLLISSCSQTSLQVFNYWNLTLKIVPYLQLHWIHLRSAPRMKYSQQNTFSCFTQNQWGHSTEEHRGVWQSRDPAASQSRRKNPNKQKKKRIFSYALLPVSSASLTKVHP